MKKLVSLVLVLVMLFSLNIGAAAVDDSAIHGGKSHDVNITVNTSTAVYKVDINWSTMDFEYTHGPWNAATHSYTTGSWAPKTATITIVNHSEKAITYGATYAEGDLDQHEAEISITDNGDGTLAAPSSSEAPRATITVGISGSPEDINLSKTKIGAINIAINSVS